MFLHHLFFSGSWNDQQFSLIVPAVWVVGLFILSVCLEQSLFQGLCSPERTWFTEEWVVLAETLGMMCPSLLPGSVLLLALLHGIPCSWCCRWERAVMVVIPWLWDQGVGKGCHPAHTGSFPFSGHACSQSLHCCVLFWHLELSVWPRNSTGKGYVSKHPAAITPSVRVSLGSTASPVQGDPSQFLSWVCTLW